VAMMSLRVNQGPSLDLSGIFKNAVNDPDTVMKLELAKSKIWNDYYQNQNYMASSEYARQQAAQEAQKTDDLKKIAATREGAVPGLERGYVGAIPPPPNQPVPVELSRITGPVNGVPVSAPPAIVDQNFYDNQVAGAKARARLDAYLAKDATDVESAYGKSIGQETLTAGLTPGGPAAVTPDQLRLGSTLYTGNAPTTTTMMTSGDTAPGIFANQDAAAKELAKANVPETKVVNGVLVRGTPAGGAYAPVAGAPQRPLGEAEMALARQEAARIEAKPREQWTPEEAALYPKLKDEIAKADQVALPDKTRLLERTPSGGVQDVPGSQAPAGEAKSFGSTGIEADYNTNLLRLNAKLRSGQPLNPDEQDLYGASYSGLAKDHWEQRDTVNGQAKWVFVKGVVSGRFPDPSQIGADGRLVGAGPAPAAAQQLVPGTNNVLADPAAAAAVAPTLTPPPTTGPQVVPAKTAPDGTQAPITAGDVIQGFDEIKPMSEGAQKDARLVPLLMIAYSHMRDFPPEDLPNAFWQVWTDPGDDPSVAQAYIAQLAPGPVKQYAQMMNQFSLNLYLLSGAAFPQSERGRNLKVFVPTLGDNAGTRAQKFEAMANLINSIQNSAWQTDPDRRHLFQKQAHDLYNVDLNDNPVAPKQYDPYSASTGGEGSVPADTGGRAAPTTFSDGKPLTRVPEGVGIDPADWPNFDEQGRTDAYQLEQALKAKGAP